MSARDFSVREGLISRNHANERCRGCSLGFPMAKRVLTKCELNNGSRLRSGAGSCQCWFKKVPALTVYMLWWASGKRKEGGTERRGGSWRPIRQVRAWTCPLVLYRVVDVYFDISLRCSYLVDPASSHMLVSKIKPCMSKYKHLYCETANGSLNQLSFI